MQRSLYQRRNASAFHIMPSNIFLRVQHSSQNKRRWVQPSPWRYLQPFYFPSLAKVMMVSRLLGENYDIDGWRWQSDDIFTFFREYRLSAFLPLRDTGHADFDIAFWRIILYFRFDAFLWIICILFSIFFITCRQNTFCLAKRAAIFSWDYARAIDIFITWLPIRWDTYQRRCPLLSTPPTSAVIWMPARRIGAILMRRRQPRAEPMQEAKLRFLFVFEML